MTVSFPRLGKFSSYYVFKYVLSPFLSVFSFWDLYNVNISMHDVAPKSLKLSSFLFILFLFFSSAAVISTALSSSSLSPSSKNLVCNRPLLAYFSFRLLYSSPLLFVFYNSSLRTSDSSLCVPILLLSSLIISGRRPVSTSLSPFFCVGGRLFMFLTFCLHHLL